MDRLHGVFSAAIMSEPVRARMTPDMVPDITSPEVFTENIRRETAALAETREPVARQRLVRRRQEALDELERRDPEGFARWLSAGATVDSDPAEYVSGDPAGQGARTPQLVASGGRVLDVVARGADLAHARENAYAALSLIDLPGGWARTDIAAEAAAGRITL